MAYLFSVHEGRKPMASSLPFCRGVASCLFSSVRRNADRQETATTLVFPWDHAGDARPRSWPRGAHERSINLHAANCLRTHAQLHK